MVTVHPLESRTCLLEASCSSPPDRETVVDVPANIELRNWDNKQPSADHNRSSGSAGFVADLAAPRAGHSTQADQCSQPQNRGLHIERQG